MLMPDRMDLQHPAETCAQRHLRHRDLPQHQPRVSELLLAHDLVDSVPVDLLVQDHNATELLFGFGKFILKDHDRA
jgi:hypothetical protein